MKWLKFSLPLLMLLAAPAQAEPYVYAPEHCEFTITFPSEPFVGRKCSPDDPKQCHETVSFTKVFDVTASLNLTVACNPAEDKMYDRYSGDVMKTTLIAMAGRGKLDEFETGFNDMKDAKMAYIFGYGKKGDHDLIYNGQLWIGQKSVFSLEADIVGDYVDGADGMFAEILHSVRLKNPPAATTEAPVENKAETKPAAKPAPKAENKADTKVENKPQSPEKPAETLDSKKAPAAAE